MKIRSDDRKNASSASRDAALPGLTIDLRGLRCPLPVLKIRKALAGLAPDQELRALCDDPLAAIDVPNYLREAGRAFVASRSGDEITFRIARRDDAA